MWLFLLFSERIYVFSDWAHDGLRGSRRRNYRLERKLHLVSGLEHWLQSTWVVVQN